MLFRIAIFVGLGSVVATIIYLTPIPEQTFLSCDRPCHHLDWPMICRVKLTLESFHSLSNACGNCLMNETSCTSKHCITADGNRRGVLTANRQLPGPSIQVCENDILVVDVVNRLPGKAATIHWRGQHQIETPSMDGVPLVTQCPIPSYTTFQYKFRASIPGTHVWHSHSASDVTNGLFGSLIVRQADVREPHRHLYDIDDPNHVILISEWHNRVQTDSVLSRHGVMKKPSVLLINGKGRQSDNSKVPLSVFSVSDGKRYRFRIAHVGGAGSCPVTFFIEDHPLLLIALDGHPVEPLTVENITLVNGERVDFILKTRKHIQQQYNIQVQTVKSCVNDVIQGSAILKYKRLAANDVDGKRKSTSIKKIHKLGISTNTFSNCNSPDNICITDVKSIKSLPTPLTEPKAEVVVYLSVNQKIHVSGATGQEDSSTLHLNNASFIYPSSPLLTQTVDVPEDILCSTSDEVNVAVRCKKQETENSACECVHIKRIPLGAVVEIILSDQAGRDDLVYHLHGYSFYIMGARQFAETRSLDEIKQMDANNVLFKRNFINPPLKDTVTIPKNGVVAIRFKADNPGYWMLRDEHAVEWTRGIDVILQVGDNNDMVPAPQDFPKCGSFIGPDYFLI